MYAAGTFYHISFIYHIYCHVGLHYSYWSDYPTNNRRIFSQPKYSPPHLYSVVCVYTPQKNIKADAGSFVKNYNLMFWCHISSPYRFPMIIPLA